MVPLSVKSQGSRSLMAFLWHHTALAPWLACMTIIVGMQVLHFF